MKWDQIHRVSSYLRSALWTVPLAAIALVLPTVPLLRAADRWLGWRISGLGPDGAQALYETVTTLTLSFMVFTFGSLLVAIQVAGGQMTPRIIATTLLRNNVIRYSVGLFVFSLVFAVMALNRAEASVNELVALFTACLGIGCMVVFLFLIDYAARLLRPGSIVLRVGQEGLDVINAVYPDEVPSHAEVDTAFDPPSGPRRVVSHAGRSDIVLAVDLVTLTSAARRAGGVIEFLPQVGDFVATDEPVFRLYGGAAAIDDRRLLNCVAFGSERTLEQDPLFAFRIMADIALKALSPAINDPTTAVLAIDQIHHLLRTVGRRNLRSDLVYDEAGVPRVALRTPNWEDFVHLSCTEIRACGAGNVQVARRLYAMLDNLLASLPAHRHPALRAERRRLDQAVEGQYDLADDRELARIPDSQGLGAASAAGPPIQ